MQVPLSSQPLAAQVALVWPQAMEQQLPLPDSPQMCEAHARSAVQAVPSTRPAST